MFITGSLQSTISRFNNSCILQRPGVIESKTQQQDTRHKTQDTTRRYRFYRFLKKNTETKLNDEMILLFPRLTQTG